MPDDQAGASLVRTLRDGDLAGQDYGHAVPRLAGAGEHIACLERPKIAKTPQAIDLVGRQYRKHLIAAIFERRDPERLRICRC